MDRLGADVPLHFTALHPDWKMMDRPPTPPQTLRMALAGQRHTSLKRIGLNSGVGGERSAALRLEHEGTLCIPLQFAEHA